MIQRFRAGLPLLYLALAYSPPGTRTPALSTNSSGFVPGAGGVRLHYLLEGSGWDTIVVLHGGPGLNLEGLRPTLVALRRSHHLLYFDQRGSGHSGMPDTLQLTADAMVEDLGALRQAFHLDRMTLLGHSWGGGLARLYAMRHPSKVERLVLVGSLPLRGLPWGEQYFVTQTARRNSAENLRMAALAEARSLTRHRRAAVRSPRTTQL